MNSITALFYVFSAVLLVDKCIEFFEEVENLYVSPFPFPPYT